MQPHVVPLRASCPGHVKAVSTITAATLLLPPMLRPDPLPRGSPHPPIPELLELKDVVGFSLSSTVTFLGTSSLRAGMLAPSAPRATAAPKISEMAKMYVLFII